MQSSFKKALTPPIKRNATQNVQEDNPIPTQPLNTGDRKMTEVPLVTRIFSAFLYGMTSIFIVFVNKILLTNYRFPSFQVVALGQIIATIIILRVAKVFGSVKFPDLSRSTSRKMFPLPLLYGLNLITGLGGTQMINLPMFTVLRRFSIPLTMILECYILGVVVTRVVCIFNNVCTAAHGVYTKKKLEAKDLGKYGVMYYNCLFMAVPTLLFCIFTGDLSKVKLFIHSDDMTTNVWVCFFISCICGFVLNYFHLLCTQHNSALTTVCIGPIKNLFVTYIGMVSSGDFVFQWLNFFGINISVFGSILYTYVTFRTKAARPAVVLPRSTQNSDEQPLL